MIWSEEEEEDENRENGERESRGFEKGEGNCHAITKNRSKHLSETESGKQNLGESKINGSIEEHFERWVEIMDQLKSLVGS